MMKVSSVFVIFFSLIALSGCGPTVDEIRQNVIGMHYHDSSSPN